MLLIYSTYAYLWITRCLDYPVMVEPFEGLYNNMFSSSSDDNRGYERIYLSSYILYPILIFTMCTYKHPLRSSIIRAILSAVHKMLFETMCTGGGHLGRGSMLRAGRQYFVFFPIW